jgi:oligoendopeptidase F
MDFARIDRATLDAMLGAMKDSFPMFRKYFKHKAKLIGKEKLAWWDIFAPLGKTDKVYSFDEARDFIVENFNKFSPELGALPNAPLTTIGSTPNSATANAAARSAWAFPAVKESRILANFDGSFDQVSTLAHEFGHAFHNECAYQGNKTELQQNTPMTLAETASIMCETIVTEAVLKNVTDPQEVLPSSKRNEQCHRCDRGYLLALSFREGSLRTPREI